MWVKGKLWFIVKEEGNVLRKEEGVGSKLCVFWSIVLDNGLKKIFVLIFVGKVRVNCEIIYFFEFLIVKG